MNIQIFNGCLLAGWFLLTLGGVMWRPDAGLVIGGVALLALTVGLALRFGLGGAPAKEADKAPGAGAA